MKTKLTIDQIIEALTNASEDKTTICPIEAVGRILIEAECDYGADTDDDGQIIFFTGVRENEETGEMESSRNYS